MGRRYRRCGAEMRGVAMARIPSSRRKPGSQRRVIARYRDPGFRRDDDYPATVLLRRLLGLAFRLAPSALGRGGGDFEAERVADLGVLAFLHPHLDLAAVDELAERSEEHTSELQSLMRISYAVFCLKTKKTTNTMNRTSLYR